MFVYVAAKNYLDLLIKELGSVNQVVDNLVITTVFKPDVVFAEDIWLDVQIVPCPSISKAAQTLKQAGKYWYLHPLSHVRRSRLIESELKKLPALYFAFPISDPLPAVGVFSLLDANTLLFSNKRWKTWPLGQCYFHEDKINPPNRAYLKLWEALTIWGIYPKQHQTALDLGASPGGWTQVLQRFGVKVTAVDKADLAPSIARLPNVTHRKQSAFALEPEKWPEPVDWLVCDIACYPQRLFNYIQRWIKSGKVKRMIVTIKLQGETDLTALAPFQALANSRVTHLFYNKHEVTWVYCKEGLGGFELNIS